MREDDKVDILTLKSKHRHLLYMTLVDNQGNKNPLLLRVPTVDEFITMVDVILMNNPVPYINKEIFNSLIIEGSEFVNDVTMVKLLIDIMLSSGYKEATGCQYLDECGLFLATLRNDVRLLFKMLAGTEEDLGGVHASDIPMYIAILESHTDSTYGVDTRDVDEAARPGKEINVDAVNTGDKLKEYFSDKTNKLHTTGRPKLRRKGVIKPAIE